MYTNVAYLHNSIAVVKDLSVPLSITSCGYYRVDEGPTIKTNRPRGRRDYQLLYIAEGKAHFFFPTGEKILSKGQMVLYRPYAPQSYFYYPKDMCEVYWVHFTGHDVENILSDYKIPTDAFFESGTSPEYQWLFEQMIRELQLCRANYKELLTLLLRHILLIVERKQQEGNKAGFEFLDEIQCATRYFNENFRKNISIEEYAASRHVSTCWFIRKFKQVVKMTPAQYILSIRIANAKDFLETRDLNVSETARAVGFDNPLYFSRVFTKHTGISPSDYKKKFKDQ